MPSCRRAPWRRVNCRRERTTRASLLVLPRRAVLYVRAGACRSETCRHFAEPSTCKRAQRGQLERPRRHRPPFSRCAPPAMTHSEAGGKGHARAHGPFACIPQRRPCTSASAQGESPSERLTADPLHTAPTCQRSEPRGLESAGERPPPTRAQQPLLPRSHSASPMSQSAVQPSARHPSPYSPVLGPQGDLLRTSSRLALPTPPQSLRPA